jgi:hypothetical protein
MLTPVNGIVLYILWHLAAQTTEVVGDVGIEVARVHCLQALRKLKRSQLPS